MGGNPGACAACAALLAALALIAGAAMAEPPAGAPPAPAASDLAEAVCADLKKPADSPEVRTCVEAYLHPRIAAHFARNFNVDAACKQFQLRAPRQGMPAVVRVELYVSADGRVLLSRVVESSGNPRFDTATVQCVMHGRFDPRDDGGKRVAAWEQLKWTWRSQF